MEKKPYAFVSAEDNCPPEGCELPHAKDPQAAYQSGYKHGLADVKTGCPDRCHWYILEPGHSFAFHTKEFNDGYFAAMCKAGISSDADQATWSCR